MDNPRGVLCLGGPLDGERVRIPMDRHDFVFIKQPFAQIGRPHQRDTVHYRVERWARTMELIGRPDLGAIVRFLVWEGVRVSEAYSVDIDRELMHAPYEPLESPERFAKQRYSFLHDFDRWFSTCVFRVTGRVWWGGHFVDRWADSGVG